MDANYVQVCTCKGTDNALCPMHSKLPPPAMTTYASPCERCKELEAMFKDRVFAAKAAEAEVDIRGQRIVKLEAVAEAARMFMVATRDGEWVAIRLLEKALKGLEG